MLAAGFSSALNPCADHLMGMPGKGSSQARGGDGVGTSSVGGKAGLVTLQHGVAVSRDDKSTAHTCFVDDHVRSHARQLEQRLHRRVNVRRAFILHMQASGVVRRPRAALLCFTLTVAMPGAGRDCSSGLVESKPPNALSRSRSAWNVHPVEWWLWQCFEFARPLLSVRAWALGVSLYFGPNLQAPMRAPEHLDPQ